MADDTLHFGAMTRDLLGQILESAGIKAVDGVYAIPEAREGTCLVGTGGDLLSVGRVVRIIAKDAFFSLETSKGEQFYFPFDRLVGLRIAVAVKERGAGFAR